MNEFCYRECDRLRGDPASSGSGFLYRNKPEAFRSRCTIVRRDPRALYPAVKRARGHATQTWVHWENSEAVELQHGVGRIQGHRVIRWAQVQRAFWDLHGTVIPNQTGKTTLSSLLREIKGQIIKKTHRSIRSLSCLSCLSSRSPPWPTSPHFGDCRSIAVGVLWLRTEPSRSEACEERRSRDCTRACLCVRPYQWTENHKGEGPHR